jgi:PHD/YefM family antitoxin component YafN of YafNO toxin-antitoxin module
MRLLRRRRELDHVRVTLTDAQWHEVALRSASDYHEWNDAFTEAPYSDYDRRLKTLDVVRSEAEWIVSLFGPGVVA